MPDNLFRDASNDGAGRNVLRHDRPRADYRAFADRHARTDRHARAQPDLVANFYRLGNHPAALLRVGIVVQCRDDRLRADENVVSNGYSALVLELTAGVDEDALADLRVLAAVIASPDRHQLGPPRLVSALHYKRELRSFAAL